MNCIVLEGVTLYIFLILVVLLMMVAVISLVCSIVGDKRNFAITNLFLQEQETVRRLARENFILKIRCGEFEIYDE